MKSFVHRAQQKTWEGGKQHFPSCSRIKRAAQHHIGSQQQSGNQTKSLAVIQARGWPSPKRIKLHHPSDWVNSTEGAENVVIIIETLFETIRRKKGVLDILKFPGLGIFKMKCF